MAQISHEIGKRIRAFRKSRHMTLEEMARILCKNKSTLSKYETGENDIPTQILIKLAEYYNTTTDYLLGRTDEP